LKINHQTADFQPSLLKNEDLILKIENPESGIKQSAISFQRSRI